MKEHDTTKELVQQPNVAPLLAIQDEPDKSLEVAQKYTRTLVKIIDDRKLYSMIVKKKYVRVEGWIALGGMVGVFPQERWSKPLARPNGEIVYESMVDLKTLNGDLIACASAICSNQEDNFKGRPEYAIKSMATTRATGKACRLAFSWIMALAGFETTPAEEMDGIKSGVKDRSSPSTKKPKGKQTPDNNQGNGYIQLQGRIGKLASEKFLKSSEATAIIHEAADIKKEKGEKEAIEFFNKKISGIEAKIPPSGGRDDNNE